MNRPFTFLERELVLLDLTFGVKLEGAVGRGTCLNVLGKNVKNNISLGFLEFKVLCTVSSEGLACSAAIELKATSIVESTARA